MKKLIFTLLAVLTVAAMNSCSEKFNVAAPYKDVTVVYGFLDMNDTAHYIRIQKGFLDDNKSALSMAKEADSNFYANLNVRIERYTLRENYVYRDSIHLNRVDLTAEGYPKQPGVFFDAPNYAYKFTNVLDPQYFYRIKITNLTTGKTDSADAPVINEKPIGGFNVPIIDDNATNLDGMAFFSVQPHRNFVFNGLYPTPVDYYFRGQTNPIGIVQAIIRFNWDDVDVTSGIHTHRSYDYNLGYQTPTATGGFFYSVENALLYNAIGLGMGQAPANTERKIDRCDITVYASTPDYSNYALALEAQGTGLTGGDVSPIYTNVKGPNAVGLFTSRAVHTGKVTITQKTVDSLKASPLLTYTRLTGTVY